MTEERYSKEILEVWPNKRWIVCAAIKQPDGSIDVGIRHAYCRNIKDHDAHGFMDNYNHFYTREEAWKIAEEMGQIRCYPPQHALDFWKEKGVEPRLFSENLY